MEQMAGKGAGKRKDKISTLKAKRKHEAMLGATESLPSHFFNADKVRRGCFQRSSVTARPGTWTPSRRLWS